MKEKKVKISEIPKVEKKDGNLYVKESDLIDFKVKANDHVDLEVESLDPDKMYVKIKDNPSQAYKEDKGVTYSKGNEAHLIDYNYKWGRRLNDELAGKIFEVDTEFLFQDQYNVIGSDIRIMDYMVEEVINDKRPLYYKCHYCGYMGDKELFLKEKACPKCKRSGYIIDLSEKGFDVFDISKPRIKKQPPKPKSYAKFVIPSEIDKKYHFAIRKLVKDNDLDHDFLEIKVTEEQNEDVVTVESDEEKYIFVTKEEATKLLKNEVIDLQESLGLDQFSEDFQKTIVNNYLTDQSIQVLKKELEYVGHGDLEDNEVVGIYLAEFGLSGIKDIIGKDIDNIKLDEIVDQVIELDGFSILNRVDGYEYEFEQKGKPTIYAYQLE